MRRTGIGFRYALQHMRRSALFSVIASLALLPASAAAQGNQEASGKAAQPSAQPAQPLPPLPPAQPAQPAQPSAPSAVTAPAPPPNTWMETEETEALPPPPPPEPAPDAPPEPAPTAAARPAPRTVEVYQEDLPPYTGPMRMASPGMFVTGLVLGGTGFIALSTGIALATSDKSGRNCYGCPPTDEEAAGALLMLGGAATLAIGGILIIYGARSVPDQPSWAKAVPAVGIGPGSATLRWTF